MFLFISDVVNQCITVAAAAKTVAEAANSLLHIEPLQLVVTPTPAIDGTSRKRAILIDSVEEEEMLTKKLEALKARRMKFQPVMDCINANGLDLSDLLEYLSSRVRSVNNIKVEVKEEPAQQ